MESNGRIGMQAIRLLLVLVGLIIAADVAAQTQRMAVASEVANIRSNPGTDSEVLWQVERYYPVLIIEKKDPWYRFKDLDGHQGWIHKSMLDTAETVIVRVRRANVRSGPGTENDIVFDAEKGTPFKVIARKEGWLNIEHADGDRGWIFKSLVW